MSRFIWLHEDCLRATHPVFAHAPQARAVFIWDDVVHMGWYIWRRYRSNYYVGARRYGRCFGCLWSSNG